jgi:hypothetical protein
VSKTHPEAKTPDEKIDLLFRQVEAGEDDFDRETSNLHNALALLLDMLVEREAITAAQRDLVNAERERLTT